MADPISIPGAELIGPVASPAAAPPQIPGAEYVGPAQPAAASAAPAGGPAAYLAAHPGMDPLAVNEAFNQAQGKGAIPQGATPEDFAAARAQMQGGFSHFGNALGRTVARPIEGAMGLISPSAGQDVRQFNDLTYGPQAGAGGFVGEQAGNLVNAPYALTAPGRILGAAEAMGNKRIDIAQQRAAGEDVGLGQEIARTAATGALDLGMNVVGNKIAGKMFGGQAAAQPFLKRLAADAAVNEGLSHASQAGQNLIDSRPVTEGMGAGSFVAPLIQTAAFAGAHEAPGFLKRMREKASGSAPTAKAPESTPLGEQSAKNAEQPPAQAQDTQNQPQDQQIPKVADQIVEHTPDSRPVEAPTEDQILAAQKDFLAKRAANDPAADHLAATIQQHLADFEQAHGEDKAEDLIAKVQAMQHEPADELANLKPTGDTANPLLAKAFAKMDADALADHGATPTTPGEQRGFEAFDKTLGQETKPPLRIAGEETAPRLRGGRRAGAITLPTHEEIAGPGSVYHEEIKPHLDKLATAGKETWSGLKNLFPVETGAGDEKAQQIFREQFNRTSNEHFRVEDAFESARKGFDKMDPDDQQHFMRQMYDNQPQATPELQKIADAMYADTNEGRKALASLGHEAAKTWDDHKWNMLWKKDEAKAQQLLAATPNRPGKIEGKAGFLKKQTLNEFEDGLKRGLVPKYDNPVEMFLATKAERGKYLAGVRGMEQLVGNDQITRAKNREAIPAGWGEVPAAAKGPLTGIIGNGKYADKLKGDGPLIAPEGVNRILKNITQPSALGNKAAFRLLMDANNTITQSMLGVSGFHIRKVAQELVNLSAARALDMGIKGQEGAGAEALRSVISPFKAAMNGGDIQKMMLGQMQPQTPQQAQVIDAMKAQFKARPDKEYETQWGRKFQKALDQGGLQGLIRAGAHAPFAMNEKLMQKGVFSFVQRAKLHMGSELVTDYLRKNPNASHDELMKETGKISDHLDNVLGLMNRDNLFWNRTARDLATLGTLSVGWNYGSGRALAGGIADMGKGLGTLREGGRLSDIDTRRISYLATTGALTALTGAVIKYMATGKPPARLRDYIFPPTGGKDRDGHDIRLNTGFYTTDYYDFFHDPIGTLSAKGSPLVHVATDLLRNKDYKGNKVFDTDEPWYKMAGDVVKYLGKSATPLSVQQLQDVIHGGGAGKSPLLEAAGFAGIKTAKRELSMSNAENAAHAILQGKQSAAGRDAAEGEKLGVKADLADQLRAKNPDARKHLQDALHKGQITPKDVHDIQKRSQEPVGLPGLLRSSQLDARDLMEKVWPKMTDDEKKANRLMVRRKIGDSNLSDAEKKSYWKKVGP